MAWYSVDFACGHTDRVQLDGKETERRSRIEYYEQFGICSICYKKQKEEAREKKCVENNAMNDAGYLTVKLNSDQFAENRNKPNKPFFVQIPAAKMKGSPKQISWAVDIKIEMCQMIFYENLIRWAASMDDLVKQLTDFDPKLNTIQAIADWTVDNFQLPVFKEMLETESASRVINTDWKLRYEKECEENAKK